MFIAKFYDIGSSHIWMEIDLIDDWLMTLIEHFLEMLDSIVADSYAVCPSSFLSFQKGFPTLFACL